LTKDDEAKDTSTTSPIETTEVLYGIENSMSRLTQAMSRVRNRADVCGDSLSPSFSMGVESIKKGYIDFKQRGVKIRFITEITKDNIHYCKELMKFVEELRHMDGVKGNMAVSETEYVATAVLQESQPVTQTIYSNTKAILEQHRYFFENLWNKSIPAEQRIKEIEEGIEPEFYDIIDDRTKAGQILVDLAKSINKQALLLLPNDKSMVRLDRLGVIDYTIKASQEKGAEVKIICPLSEVNSEILKQISNKAPNIMILNGNISPYGMYIVDGEKLLRAELREPNAETLSESIGFTFYSNSKLSADSFKSVFELLWKEHVLNEELRRTDKMQKEFINIAAHELRTPIQPIIGLSEIILNNMKDTQQAKLLEVINRNAKRLHRLTEDILDVTKIDSQSLNLKKEQFNIADLISNIVDDHRSDLQKKPRNVVLLYEPNDKLVIDADKGRITQVISNLLSNAIKFTKEGSISIDVVKNSKYNNSNQQEVQGEVMVSVKDTGTGIDPEILPRLFTKFATKSEIGGTGLGLFISKNIIEAHGGSMWANNNVKNKGATFSFTLPLSK
jgi:signal transduction histidine kinase